MEPEDLQTIEEIVQVEPEIILTTITSEKSNTDDSAPQLVNEPVPKTTETPKNQEDKLELNEALLEILGEEPTPGEEKLVLHSSIAKRWGAWLKTPMAKEVKEDLFKKYPRAGDFSLDAPKMNEELISSLNESTIKKDRYFVITQNLVGTALSALAPAITALIEMKSEDANKVLGDVWNAARVMAEIHRSQTAARLACILPSLTKSFAEALSKREADKSLFGEHLSEKIAQMKTCDKLGQEIKMQPPKKPHTNPLNWRSSSAPQKSTSQTSYKIKPPAKASAPKRTAKPSSYPKSSQYHYKDYRQNRRA